MKSIILVVLLICIFNIINCNGGVENHHKGGDKPNHHKGGDKPNHHNDNGSRDWKKGGDHNKGNSQEYSFIPPSTSDYPINAEQSCLVNPSYTTCFSNTCPTVSSCVSYLNGQTSYNIFISPGSYSKCLGSISINSATSVGITSMGAVSYDCNTDNGIFLNFATGSQVISFTISGLNIYNGRINIFGGNKQSTFNLYNSSISNVNSGPAVNVPNFIANIKQVQFDTCYSANDGGAINSNNYLVVDNSTFTNCYSNTRGGAIYGQTIFITSSLFQSCNSYSGGAVYSQDINVVDSVFQYNSANMYGGAIFANNGSLSIQSSVLVNNSAVNGGAIFYSSSQGLKLSQVSITNNTAVNGGAIYLAFPNVSVYMINSQFVNNFISSNDEGGAIFVYSPESTLLYGGIFYYPSGDIQYYPFTRSYMNAVNTVQIQQFSDCVYRPVVAEYQNPRTPLMCVGVTGICKYGHATINNNGSVTSCECYPGYMGLNCTEPIPSSSEQSSSSLEPSSSEQSSSEQSSSEQSSSEQSSSEQSSSSVEPSSSSSNSSSSYSSSESSSSVPPQPTPVAWLFGILIIFIAIVLFVIFVVKHIFHHHHPSEYMQLHNYY